MRHSKKLIILIIISVFFLAPQRVTAESFSGVVDKTINYTATATYYVTKYTLKAGWFILKKTAKGVKIISKSAYRAGKDAFSKKSTKKPEYNTNKKYEYKNSLPPPPPLLE